MSSSLARKKELSEKVRNDNLDFFLGGNVAAVQTIYASPVV